MGGLASGIGRQSNVGISVNIFPIWQRFLDYRAQDESDIEHLFATLNSQFNSLALTFRLRYQFEKIVLFGGAGVDREDMVVDLQSRFRSG